MSYRFVLALVAGAAVVVGCADSGDGPLADDETLEVPDVDLGGVEARQNVGAPSCVTGPFDASNPIGSADGYNCHGSWSISAGAPIKYGADSFSTVVQAQASVSGPSNSNRRVGSCLLNIPFEYASLNYKTCSLPSDCSAYVPSGGYAYCDQIDGSGLKYCLIRPGAPGTYCNGTPGGNGLQTPVEAQAGFGTFNAFSANYTTFNYLGAWFYQAAWVTMSCFAGCTAHAASVSPVTSVFFYQY